MALKKQQGGFSLIELMFILAFLAIILMYSVSMTRDQARQDAIENTAIGIKNWLQTALAYYADNGAWPSDFNSDVVGNYLPAELVCTEFAGTTPDGACTIGNTSFTGTDNGKYYTVSAYVPDESIAKAIAGKLPSAQANDNQVSSSVPIPGAQQGYITSAGIVTVGDQTGVSRQIWLPPCEVGFEAHYLVTPQYYTTGYTQNEKGDDTSKYFVTLMGLSKLHKVKDRYLVYANTNFADDRSTFFGFIPGSKHRYGYYITYCVPEGNWDPSGRDKITNNSGAADPQQY